MKKLLIFGATELASLAYYYASEAGREIAGFVLDESYMPDIQTMPAPLYVWTEAVNRFSPDEMAFFVAIGYKKIALREAIYNRVKRHGYELVNIVSDASWLATDATMADNNFIMPGAVVEPGAVLGANNVIWSNATVCHDTHIGSHNFIAANVTLGGGVSIGDRNFLGFSSVVLQGRRIRDDSLIAAASLVTSNLDGLTSYRGSPAKKFGVIDSQTGVMVD